MGSLEVGINRSVARPHPQQRLLIGCLRCRSKPHCELCCKSMVKMASSICKLEATARGAFRFPQYRRETVRVQPLSYAAPSEAPTFADCVARSVPALERVNPP